MSAELSENIDLPEANAVPEMPNIITLFHRYFQNSHLFDFLHNWENLVFSIFIAMSISFIFYFCTRKREMIPSGIQNCLESIVEGLRNVIVDIIGPQGEKYVPFLGTLFIYILTMNIFALVPLMKSPSSNLNTTTALAICVFALVQYLNIKNMGFFGFLYHLAGSPKDFAGWMIAPLMFPIEILTQLSRPITLAFRLFGNIFGEDTIIAVFALFGVALFAYFHIPFGFPLQIPFMFFVLLTGLMQALVFTLLSAVYILLSTPHSEEKPLHA